MAKVTSRTVRVTEITLNVDEDRFREVAKRLSQSIEGRWPFSSQPGDPNPKVCRINPVSIILSAPVINGFDNVKQISRLNVVSNVPTELYFGSHIL
jgi:hypothetical protein